MKPASSGDRFVTSVKLLLSLLSKHESSLRFKTSQTSHIQCFMQEIVPRYMIQDLCGVGILIASLFSPNNRK